MIQALKSDNLQLPAGIKPASIIHNATPEELQQMAIENGEGVLSSSGALMINTGKFTGRSPEDKYIVKDALTENRIWWGDVNKPMGEDAFFQLLAKMADACRGKKLYVQDLFACADPTQKICVRVISSTAYHSLFANNMFIRPTMEERQNFQADYTVIALPEFTADPEHDKTRSPQFVTLNLSKKLILIGGTGYTGEVKKSIFSVLNYLLPTNNLLSMHCSANLGKDGDAAIFFGLSGTGKTTLSADPNRGLIGDDEHGWSENGIFNFEGGCYAKVINLSKENEPQIWNAIRPGALLENVVYNEDSKEVDFSQDKITANTRVSYPLNFIDNAVIPSIAGHPKNIFFLTADAWGVLPPISKLNPDQAMFHFVSGYTARVAGTEQGITEPKTVFSACFGAPFLPLHPLEYAKLLGEKMQEHKVNVWLVNTGWTGGEYGTGKRISIPHTRALITAALNGDLNNVEFVEDSVFGFQIPVSVPNVPSEILNPRNAWSDKVAYDKKARSLAEAFVKNIEKYNDSSRGNIMAGAPAIMATAGVAV